MCDVWSASVSADACLEHGLNNSSREIRIVIQIPDRIPGCNVVYSPQCDSRSVMCPCGLRFGFRPMGAAALLAVKDKTGPQLYLVDPAGTGLVISGLPFLD